ncbi:ABC transporter ATP-binding protein [Aureimonas jatrophae]|uniref:Amino acid/amide ABC transporter ATP-binding protein 2, HAAT family n=1 Tax=Aureimonas jatrophae TaxID=1166073 RepID=A0A1H0EZV6_9HYPH|nr:ABC transporter ATP-binding protein [Aureimonas jatrophae]MBB3950243.1 branched-chain amino acid transport system ATP-binding protein [Aureimonas jatrophae]SDN87816.1 amino acid/amide ABC transporter ATP-binding protein 2, HAAT family [Aureimonas jatrophae]
MPALEVEVDRLVAGYGPTVILEDVSFRVAAGERLAILGRNGMGKTTLLASLMGLTRQRSGRIRVGQDAMESLPTSRRALGGLGYVPQGRDVFRSLTVEENLLVGLKGRERGAVEEAYALFPRLRERRRNLGHQLSGGEQQMLATARAILGRPGVLLLDEPLEGLAPIVCEELMTAFGALAARGDMTILLVEQRVESALAFADTILVLERGRLAWHGRAAAFEPSLVERYVGVGSLH